MSKELQLVLKLANFKFKIYNHLFFAFKLFFFVFFEIFKLEQVGLENISHSDELLKRSRNFLLQGWTEDTSDFRLHIAYHTFDFFLISRILYNESALEF